jgi:hypothetical protein
MKPEERELLSRLERERVEARRQERERLAERRRRALERPEARAEWDRLAREEAERDARATGTPAEWLTLLATIAIRDRDPDDPIPEREDLEAVRDWYLERIEPDDLAAYRGLLTLPDTALAVLADTLWLHAHGLADDE